MASSERVVVIGDPASVFVQTPVRFWRERGIDARILTARWSGPATVDADLPVESAERLAPPWVHAAARGLYPVLEAASAVTLAADPARVTAALSAWAHTAVPPSIAPPVHDALLIAAAADALAPVAVFGHEAFAYGLATSLCRAPRRALLAWGADVLQFAPMTDVTTALVRQAVHGVHYVLTNADAMADAVHTRFALPRDRIAHFSYGVDRQMFRRATGARARHVRRAWGIPDHARVVMNLRRFLPHWGSDVAWPAMLALVQRRPDVHLILLDGAPTPAAIDRAADEARARGVDTRVTWVRGQVALSQVAELMSVTDVGLSLVRTLEPVSWSVQQAAACGAAVVVADQASYAHERTRGLAVDGAVDLTPAGLVATMTRLLDDRAVAAEMATANQRYLVTHQNCETELTRLLRLVAGADAAERLLATGVLARR